MSDLRPTGLLLDLQERAAGVDGAALRFSWIVPMLGDARQRTYRLQILADPAEIADPADSGADVADVADVAGTTVWDSGDVASDRSTGVLVEDVPLAPATPYWWRVRVETSQTGRWSEPALFTTAPSDWPATPIWAAAPAASSASAAIPDWALLRTEIELPDVPVRAAFIEAIGLSPDGGPEGGPWTSADDAADAGVDAGVDESAPGPRGGRQHVYKLWTNGQVVGFGSVRSEDERPRLHTHHVAEHLRPGRNAIAALCWAQHGRQFAARLVVVLADGTRIEHLTGPDTWQAMPGSALLPGEGNVGGWWYFAPAEDWDLREEPVGWTQPGFGVDEPAVGSASEAARGWVPASAADPLPAPPVPATVSLGLTAGADAQLVAVGPRTLSFDLGREIVGGLRVRLTAPDGRDRADGRDGCGGIDGRGGARLAVRLGEQRDADGRVVSPMPTGNLYEETWTLRAGAQEVEHWGYRAFRYGELELLEEERGTDGAYGADAAGRTSASDAALASDLLASVQVTPMILHSPHRHTGAFASSEADLDRVHELCRYSIEATALDLYLDTPARERLPYEGDAFVNQRSQYACERSYALGRATTSYLARRPTWPAEYHLMPVLNAWDEYLATGDDALLRRDLELWRAANYDRFLEPDGLLHKDPGVSSAWDADLVDWPETCRDGYILTPVNTVLNAFQAAAHEALAKIGTALEESDVAAHHAGVAARLRAGVEEHLVRPDGTYRDGLGTDHSAQHANAVPAALGLVPAERADAVAEALAAGGMRMSVYGAQLLLDGLFALGRADAAIALMTARGERSWLHLIDDLGASIVPEAWDPGLKPNMTYSHAWGTAPVNVIARWVLGVRVVAPGAARLEIAPQPGPLTRIDGTVPTIRGDVRVRLERADGRAGERAGGRPDGRAVGGLLHVEIPANTTARVRCAGIDREVGPGTTRFDLPRPLDHQSPDPGGHR
ncbi:alpha-L-rhamnosidase-related protein [Brachybacterium sp. DNPG3]